MVTIGFATVILSYLSFISLSNFSELTQKKILEEENALAVEYSERFRFVLDSLALAIGSNADPFDKSDFKEEIIYEKEAHFLSPLVYDGDVKKSRTPENSRLDLILKEGEKFEFVEKSPIKAEKSYKRGLSMATSSKDSAIVLNAIGRVQVKQEKIEQAFSNYQSLLTLHPAAVNDLNYPYAYFSISQMLSLDSLSEKNINILTVSLDFFLSGILENKIPLAHSLRLILQKILGTKLLESSESADKIKSLATKVEERLDCFFAYKEHILKFNNHKLYELKDTIKSLFVFNLENRPKEMLLLKRESNLIKGYILEVEKLHDLILLNLNLNKDRFNYGTELVHSRGFDIQEKEALHIQSGFSHFFPGSEIRIFINDLNQVDQVIFKRKLMTVTGLILFFAAMGLGLFVMRRELQRKKRLDQLRKDFISNVTHEFKTPLTSINLFAESLATGRFKSDEKIRKYAEIIGRESMRLKRLVGNILEFSRKESSSLEYVLRQCDLRELILNVILEMDYWLEANEFEVIKELDDPVFAYVDPEGLKQVLSNIASNAIKYSDEVKEITFRLVGRNNKAVIEIEDRGIGIPESLHHRIFEKYYRIQSEENNSISGTGLGLTVCKDIIEAMGGTIQVKSEVGKGSTFILSLNQ